MQEQFLVMKPGYINEDGSCVDAAQVAKYQNEINAIDKLREFPDDEEYYIQKETKQYIADGIYDWDTDRDYGLDGKKWMWNFTEKELAR